MIITHSKPLAVAFGLLACLLGCVTITLGDHHAELLFKALVAAGVVLVLAGLFLPGFSWTIRKSH